MSAPALNNNNNPRSQKPKWGTTLKRPIDEIDNMDTPSSASKRSRMDLDPDAEMASADEDEDLESAQQQQEAEEQPPHPFIPGLHESRFSPR